MEEEMKKNWAQIKDLFVTFEKINKNPCHPYPYPSQEEMNRFERIMKKTIRRKKLERIVNDLSDLKSF